VIGDTTEELESLKGRKLLKINDVPFAQFIGPILEKLSGERMAFRIRGFMHKQRVYWVLIPLTKDPELSITVLDSKGRSERLTVELLSLREYDIGVPKTQREKKESYYELHHGGKTCYWQYNSFVYSEGEKRDVDCLFALLKEKEVENLIIDLRFNSGGNSSAGDYILDYLTAKPYGQFSKFDVKLSDQVLEKGRETRLRELAGLTVSRRLAPRKPEEKGFRFGGRLFLLTGADTFSSAASFAAAVKDYEIGTIIGEETGGLRQCFGDQVRFRLPNSGISFGVSYKRFYAPIPKPNDDISGVVPDIDIDEEMLSEFSNAEDPLLAFTLDYVQRN
jgi:C-terminal processing protease CtpA/Prc